MLTVSQIMWAKGVHELFDLEIPLRIDTSLLEYEKICIADLNDLAALTRKNLTSLFRKVLCALITIDVHARDTIAHMVEKHVQRALVLFYDEVDGTELKRTMAYEIGAHVAY